MEQQEEKAQNDHKPVGYGSSIQSSGFGNKNRPQQPEDKSQSITDENQKIEEDKRKEKDE